ncbi:hypothetical protein J6590_067623 [Homalodisca vitripennis]|nr:hypothetical protein J6590_067623 [Homalodisca vitripennis]
MRERCHTRIPSDEDEGEVPFPSCIIPPFTHPDVPARSSPTLRQLGATTGAPLQQLTVPLIQIGAQIRFVLIKDIPRQDASTVTIHLGKRFLPTCQSNLFPPRPIFFPFVKSRWWNPQHLFCFLGCFHYLP